ncbi:TRAP transporter substrate-binding protein [Haloarcula amylovorans]|uniref:TRAP transporter substrate-binding protein n=1 Tax=Haloarcula amylovorans TaxID=2562280 RepID=UPI001FD7577B|nr:TRAP transporter substrate-binding protein [Halomicroarcula amylolytica]
MSGLAGCANEGNNSTGGNSGGGNSSGNGGTTGSTDSGGSNNVQITLGSTENPENIQVRTAKRFAENVEEMSGGDISATISAGGSYGSVEEIADLVSQNVIQMSVGGFLPLDRYASEYYFIDSPFVIEDYQHMKKLVQSEKFQPALDQLQERGNQTLIGQPIYRGYRHFTSNKPINAPEDVQGLNLRLPQLSTWIKVWEEIGASPTPVALDELYSALQQGVADASEGDIQQIHSQSLYEVQSHLSLTSHLLSAGIMTINHGFLTGLDETHQETIEEAANKATQWGAEKGQSAESKLIDEVANKGMTVVRDVDKGAFREAGRPAVEQLFENQWAKTWDYWRDV